MHVLFSFPLLLAPILPPIALFSPPPPARSLVPRGEVHTERITPCSPLPVLVSGAPNPGGDGGGVGEIFLSCCARWLRTGLWGGGVLMRTGREEDILARESEKDEGIEMIVGKGLMQQNWWLCILRSIPSICSLNFCHDIELHHFCGWNSSTCERKLSTLKVFLLFVGCWCTKGHRKGSFMWRTFELKSASFHYLSKFQKRQLNWSFCASDVWKRFHFHFFSWENQGGKQRYISVSSSAILSLSSSHHFSKSVCSKWFAMTSF